MSTDALSASSVVIAVDPTTLRQAATDIEAAAPYVTDGGQLAGPVHPGWECTQQLAATAQAWVDYLGRLRTKLGDLASDLRNLADHFVVADHDAGAGWPDSGGYVP